MFFDPALESVGVFFYYNLLLLCEVTQQVDHRPSSKFSCFKTFVRPLVLALRHFPVDLQQDR